MAQAAGQLQKQMAGALSVVAIEEFIRHSYKASTEAETNMRRVQLATGETSEEIEHLKKQFEDLSKVTGRNLGDLATGFRDFMARSGLQDHEAAKAFDMITKAAEIAGVETRDMSRLTGTAMADLKLKMEDLPHVTAEFAKTIAALGPTSAKSIAQITDQLDRLHQTWSKSRRYRASFA